MLLGFLLLILPGIYLVVAYMLAIPLAAEKNLNSWKALEVSRKAITHKWFKTFGLFLMIWLILIISILPLGIGLIWTVPWAVNAIGILYREIFGVEATE